MTNVIIYVNGFLLQLSLKLIMDWKKIIEELCDAGMTQTIIASELGVNQATISNLVRGRNRHPAWDTGDALIKLHQEKCNQNQKIKLHPDTSCVGSGYPKIAP